MNGSFTRIIRYIGNLVQYLPTTFFYLLEPESIATYTHLIIRHIVRPCLHLCHPATQILFIIDSHVLQPQYLQT